MHVSGHFTAVVIWHGTQFRYDCMHDSNERFVPCEAEHPLENRSGGYAYYFIDIV